MRVFILVISSVLAFIWAFVWFRLVAPAQPSPAFTAMLLALFFLTFALQPARWAFHIFFHDHRALLLGTYIIFGLMVHLFFATLVKDLALLFTVSGPLSLPGARFASGMAAGLAILANFWGLQTAWRGPRIRTIAVPMPHWPPGAPAFRIAQISDLHVGAIIQEPYVKKVVEKVNALGADAIAITGDLGDGSVAELGKDLAPLRHLQSRCGTYYVTGNHEYYWNAREWMQAARDLGFHPLHNEGKKIPLGEGSLWLAGVPDFSSAGEDSQPERTKPPGSQLLPKILLAHQPKSVYKAAAAGFDLMLSGHTHNGQFFPISLLVGRFNPYSKGLNRHGKLWVYVNVGTGFWGPPQRLGVRAEITLLELSGAPVVPG